MLECTKKLGTEKFTQCISVIAVAEDLVQVKKIVFKMLVNSLKNKCERVYEGPTYSYTHQSCRLREKTLCFSLDWINVQQTF